MTTKRRVSYQWRLREVMASRGIFTISDLVTPLAERGITLSVSQVHRLATGTPERLSLPVLAALCDILEVTPSELIATRTTSPNSTDIRTSRHSAASPPGNCCPDCGTGHVNAPSRPTSAASPASSSPPPARS
jgi:DNA-binding Xre family transcriptional regulator